jgi:hypothetical protein
MLKSVRNSLLQSQLKIYLERTSSKNFLLNVNLTSENIYLDLRCEHFKEKPSINKKVISKYIWRDLICTL